MRHYKLPKNGPSTFPLSSSTCLLISWSTFVFSEYRLAPLLLESIKRGIWPEELAACVPASQTSVTSKGVSGQGLPTYTHPYPNCENTAPF